MNETEHKTKYLKDYRPPDYLIENVELHFDLGEEVTSVKASLHCSAVNKGDETRPPLVLDGRDLTLVSLALNGRRLQSEEYRADRESLSVFSVPDTFVLEIGTKIGPRHNTSLEGLYLSSGNFCTQCEAQGFRKITYFIDRPDVMTRYTVTIAADRDKYPVLLANGNLVDSGELPENRHYAVWQDPFPKPCYLFALVAGDLGLVEDLFVTRSGRTVALRIYVQHHNIDRCDHAMRSLKKAMRWDEEVFGLEYDLDLYMIVAVDDFNMGAMENKGLNIFNSKYVLARPDTATDDDYEGIERVVAHEYFHNWTGNRVTCRDWFQLSLKEGLTVFRDQEFSADMLSRAVKRIGDVQVLRNRQFPEDSGPMAHAVRPESYIEINNFYTVTVYEKGAEVIRMLHTFCGQAGFCKGMDLYFARHDGRAVTTDDFVQAMADACGIDFSQFCLWYSQAGTPEMTVTGEYDPTEQSYTLIVTQNCPPTPGQPLKDPFHIPLTLGLLNDAGRDLPLRLAGETGPAETRRVLNIRRPEETFRFVGVPCRPVPSLLRNFSAPVKLTFAYSDEELCFLLAHDSDPFNRWEAGQRLAERIMLGQIRDWQQGREPVPSRDFIRMFKDILEDDGLMDKAFVCQLLTLPTEEYLAERMEVIDVAVIHAVRESMRKELAISLRDSLLTAYRRYTDSGPYQYDPAVADRRRLKNLCLSYLMCLEDVSIRELCFNQFQQADNMTDAMSALLALVYTGAQQRQEALDAFYSKWRDDALVLDKWLSVQATAPLPGTLSRVRELMGHPAFSIKNPNKVRALIGAFCGGNPVCFHEPSGAGYRFLADRVLEINPLNPQIAARLLGNLSRWRRYDTGRQALMRAQLERIRKTKQLSRDVYEVVVKSLS